MEAAAAWPTIAPPTPTVLLPMPFTPRPALSYALLLTAALASGMVFSKELFGKPATLNHKTVFSVLAWLLFGVLLAGRWRWGWRGRRALRSVVLGSVLLLIGYAGSKFVLEIILGRA